MKRVDGQESASQETFQEFSDEILENCPHCGCEHMRAYWDYELEYYIYLSDSNVCTDCVNEPLENRPLHIL